LASFKVGSFLNKLFRSIIIFIIITNIMHYMWMEMILNLLDN